MSISAIIPISDMETANELLGSQGFGYGNFSVPLREGDAEATHAGLHCWDDAAFLAALQAIPGVSIDTNGEDAVLFSQHTTAQLLEWSDPTNWFVNPVMIGDERAHGGKTWVSLINYNVWTPPVGWREVVEDGYPAWVQPTGAQDAYAIGNRVTHDNPNDGGAIWVYQSAINANTTQPGRDGTFDRWWTPIEAA